jgi:hypothetical protein
VEGKGVGELDTYYDLITDHPDFLHRRAAAPSRIAKAMAPVVDAVHRHSRVASLVEEAPSLLPPGFAKPEAIRRGALHIMRVAALKGFVELSRGEA